jgi:hypothetical protein
MNVNPDLFGANVTAQTAQGNIGQAGIPTLAAQNQNFNQGLANKQANWGAYMDVVGQTQNLGQGPQSNWGNLINQAGTGQNTFAANQNQFNQGVTMAQLTGFLPDGTPTSAQQQQDLSNLWTVAQQTGIIPNQLADLYNLPRGSRTQDAIAQAAQIAISQQNANTSAFSASTGRMNANNSQLMDIWKATGQAPDGITGVAKGTPYASTSSSNDQKYDYKSDPSFAQGISWVNANPSTALEAIRKDSATFIDRFGYSGYQEMLKAAEAVAP